MNATAKKSVKPATGKAADKKSTTAAVVGKPAKTTASAVDTATTRSVSAVPTVKTPAAKSSAAAAKSAAAKQASSDDVESGKRMSANNADAVSPAKIERTVVSKASEVVTKVAAKVVTKTSKAASGVLAEGVLLSEAQIVKMGEKDYMNAAQLAFFKARLQQLERDLLRNAGETTEHLRETVLVPDPADRATIEEEHALELRTRDRERKLLKKVQQSIASIDSGDYGWCEETGEPIGVPRLLARPTATLSLEAQQRRELKQKLYGD